MAESKVWNQVKGKLTEVPEDVSKFYEDIEKVCREHGMSISHEDGHGAFIVESFSEENLWWLKSAHLNLPNKR